SLANVALATQIHKTSAPLIADETFAPSRHCKRGRLRSSHSHFQLHPLKRILQHELNSPRWCHRVRRRSKSRRFEKAHRDAEVGAVDKVEYLSAENDLLCARYREAFDERQIQIEQLAGAKSVAAHSSILTHGRKHAGNIISCQAQRLLCIASGYD